jgi:hypothetical protein
MQEVATESASSTGGISVLEGIAWSCRAAGASMRSAGYISDAQANAFEGLADASVDESKADLVVVLDVPPEVCLERRLSGAKSTPLPGFGQTQGAHSGRPIPDKDQPDDSPSLASIQRLEMSHDLLPSMCTNPVQGTETLT